MVHCCDRFLGGNNLAYVHQPLYAFAIRGQLGVILFFIISGYCITAAAHSALYSGKPLRRYCFERGRRIFPPYWVALLLGVAMQLAIHTAESHHWIAAINHPVPLIWTPLYWIANLTLTQYELHSEFANVVFWSLCYEIAFYAIVGVWLWLAQRVAARRNMAAGQLTLILGISATTFVSLLVLIATGQGYFPWDLWPQFGLGGILFYWLESSQKTVAGYSPFLRRLLHGIAAIAFVLSLVYAAFRQVGLMDMGHPSSKLRTLACLMTFVLLAALRPYDIPLSKSRWLRPFLWLGAFSYSLYLVHPIFLPFIDVLGRKAGLDGHLYWVNFWLQVGVAVVCGRLFYLLIERRFISSNIAKRLREEHVA
jgi:peptidoglycan/LPS O-acetylase OafA/YrhL